MLTEEMEHRIGSYQTFSSVECREKERRELDARVKEFLTAGGKIKKEPIYRRNDPSSYNRCGPLTPDKNTRWGNVYIGRAKRV